MDSFFIDYDNLLDLAEDQYHVFYGNPEDIDYADYIASFAEEEDAKEYIEWKNDNDEGEGSDGYEGDFDYGEEPGEDFEDPFREDFN